MLSKQYRLKKRKTFNYVYRKGRSVGCANLTLVYCFARMKNIKVGFSVSKKVGNSVIRHRATRKMRAACRPLVPKMAANHTYIFVAKEAIKDVHVDKISEDMQALLKKAGLVI